jgi:hypothetical protein
MPDRSPVRFVPSRVEGPPDVSEVAVFPDRVEIHCAGTWRALRFQDFARWPVPGWWWRFLFSMGIRKRLVPIADRDWCRAPRDRFFSFYTVPRIVVYMPEHESEDYGQSVFFRVKEAVESAGFGSVDLA